MKSRYIKRRYIFYTSCIIYSLYINKLLNRQAHMQSSFPYPPHPPKSKSNCTHHQTPQLKKIHAPVTTHPHLRFSNTANDSNVIIPYVNSSPARAYPHVARPFHARASICTKSPPCAYKRRAQQQLTQQSAMAIKR